MRIKILIAGEHFPFLNGLDALTKSVLGNNSKIEIAHTYGEILEKITNQDFHILISDIFLDGMDSLTMTEKVLVTAPELKVIIVGIYPNDIFAPWYLDAGAFGYVCTSGSEEEFKKAIRQVYFGKRYIQEEVKVFTEDFTQTNIKKSKSPFDHLSKQEFAVLLLLLKGKGVKEVSRLLDLRISTASTYKIRLFKKLKVNNFIELANMAANFKLGIKNLVISDHNSAV